MCGISGSINADFSYDKVLDKMGHRGPDENGKYRSGNVNFFHLRLSILDITFGKQPMQLDDRFTIIYNGEIFNHAELREKYGLKGNTSSDTETLLLLYEKFDTGFLDFLDGMFVFAIHDKVKNRLIIARDRAGLKPVYYYHDGKELAFASELNGLKEMVNLEPEPLHFYQYLRLGTFYRRNTPYKNVEELPGGHYLTIDCSSLEIKETRWWNIHTFYQQNSSGSLEESIAKVDSILHTAIKRRIETSDLEVGAFLSGGIDSGLVTAIAKNYSPSLKTFTVSFDGEYDEAPLARLVADKYQTRHTEIGISFDHLQNDVEKILANYGEPFFDSSAIPSYYVSKAAREHVTVILNGDGADELFGGYRRYVPFAKLDFFKSNPLVRNSARFLKSFMSPSDNKKSKYNYLFRLISLMSKTGLDVYLSAGVDIFEDFEKNINAPDYDYLQLIKKDFSTVADSELTGLRKIMNLDFDINLCNDLLVKMDIATMANSQEGRSPFLCKDILEYVPTLPDSFKVKGKTTKYLLRKLAEKYLPETLIYQPKRGFEIPLKKWVNNQLAEMINGYLRESNTFFPEFVNKTFVLDLLENKINISAEKRAKILWTIFSMEVWYHKVYKAD